MILKKIAFLKLTFLFGVIIGYCLEDWVRTSHSIHTDHSLFFIDVSFLRLVPGEAWDVIVVLKSALLRFT